MFPGGSETGLLKYFPCYAWDNEVTIANRELHTWTATAQWLRAFSGVQQLFAPLPRARVACRTTVLRPFPWGCCRSCNHRNLELPSMGTHHWRFTPGSQMHYLHVACSGENLCQASYSCHSSCKYIFFHYPLTYVCKMKHAFC